MQDTGKNNGKNPNEGEIAELVRQKEALTDQENSLQAAKDAISREKKMAYETRERLAARLAEVEKERISEITRLDSIARETARRDGERMVAESKERLAARLAEVDKERAMELARLESLTQDTLRRETERLAAESRARLAERLAEVDKGCAARLAEVDRERAEKNARLDDLAQDLARRERETLESNERLSARLAEVERESSEKLARLESRSHDLARREGEVLDAEKRLQERMKEPVGQILAVEQELKAEKERSALLREEVNNSKAHIESVLREAAVLEEELVGVKEKHFKAEAQKDAEWSKKMNDLIALMGEKERELESSWSRRHNTLETEEKQYHADFEKRH
ncbi:MAG: hypothetical protein WCK76_14135, partial [Elusimicrobiota bacterium]